MNRLLIFIVTLCGYFNIFAQKGEDIFMTIFPKDNTSFKIYSEMQNNLTYTRYDDKTEISKFQNKALEVTEFHNNKRHIFSAKFLSFNDSTITITNQVSRTTTINTENTLPTYIDKMFMLPIGKPFNIYLKESGEGFSSRNVENLTKGAESLILPTITKGLANVYLKSLDYTYNEEACYRLVESAAIMPHKYGWKEIKTQDTVTKKTIYHYISNLHSVCGIKAEFEIKYSVKKVTKDKYVLIGSGSGIQHFNEERVTLWTGEGKMFCVRPKDIKVDVEIEVDRTSGLVNKAVYKAVHSHTANEETSPGKPNDLVYFVEWNCVNTVSSKK